MIDEILKSTNLSPEDEKRLKPRMTGWTVVAKTLYTAPIHEVLQMLKYEVTHANRPFVREKIHMRYSALRRNQEREHLKEYDNG